MGPGGMNPQTPNGSSSFRINRKNMLFTNKSEDYPSILEKESKLFKCIKVIADLTIGIGYLQKIDIFIPSIFGGLYSARPQVRKWASDIITYFYHKTNSGPIINQHIHKYVNENVHLAFIKELYSAPNKRGLLDANSQRIVNNTHKVQKYEAWIWCFLRLLQGRGKLGSKVGAYDEFKYSGTITDSYLIEYGLSTLLLIQTLLANAGELAERTKLRRMFKTAGLMEVFDSLKPLDNC
ncbi:unnamed protein product [Ambrosiozyma monospora]|uniref:Unnamed protein product n=1 Tax=Ambrosiozyma monospora TaxID=43982 RepID=A0ACB5THW3_AMBMO|nr:unnamed protein product [Ambrosiozyma monospora]